MRALNRIGRLVALCVGFVALLHGSVASAEDETESKPDRSDVEVVVIGNFFSVGGDGGAFSERAGVSDETSGGIQRLGWSGIVGKDANLSVEGRAIFDTRDYLLDLELEVPGTGTFEAGFRHFRTWYDSTGGFFPLAGGIGAEQVFGNSHALDRGEGWFAAELRPEGLPEIDLSYRYRSRDGSKDSLARGDINTAVAGNADFGIKRIAPAGRAIDETIHEIDAEVRQAVGADANVGAGIRYRATEIDNGLQLLRRPGEIDRERSVSQGERVDGDALSARAFSEARFLGDSLVLSSMYSFSDVANDVSGTRVYTNLGVFGGGFDAGLANRQPFDRGFLALDGETGIVRHSGRVNAVGRMNDDVSLRLSVGVEQDEIDGYSDYTETVVGGGASRQTSFADFGAQNSRDSVAFTESAELRIHAVPRSTLWVRADWRQDRRDLYEMRTLVDDASVDFVRDTDEDTDEQEYSAGAAWYPSSRWNMTASYGFRLRDSDYDDDVDVGSPNDPGTNVSIGSTNRYPAYLRSLDRTEHTVHLRSTWRAHDAVRLVARYDLALGNVDVSKDGLSEVETAEQRTHRVGGTVSWTPIPTAWGRAEATYVLSETETPTNDLTGAAENLVTDASNDYWNLRLSTGAALSKASDLEASYSYLGINNYRDNSEISQPYGAESSTHVVSLGLAHRVSESMRVGIRYAYINNDEETQGGQNDYDASIVRTTFELGF